MSLSDHAVLVTLSVPEPAPSRLDKGRSRDIERAEDAGRGSARVSIRLFAPDDPLISARRQAISRLRTEHVRRTLPWQDAGPRLVHRSELGEYQAAIGPLVQAVEAAQEAVADHAGEIELRAREALRGLFQERATRQALTRPVRPSLSISPVPDWESCSWRDSLSADDLAARLAEQSARDSELASLACRDVLRRVVLLLGGVQGDPNNKGVLRRLEGESWRGDALAQVRELSAVLPGLVRLCEGSEHGADVQALAGEIARLGELSAPSAISWDSARVAAIVAPVRSTLLRAQALLGDAEWAAVDAVESEPPAVEVVVPAPSLMMTAIRAEESERGAVDNALDGLLSSDSWGL